MDKSCKIRTVLAFFILVFTIILVIMVFAAPAKAAGPRIKFYDFSDQLIDGEVKQPTALYLDSRQEVKFQRLLKLKRNLLGDNLNKTARNRVFK